MTSVTPVDGLVALLRQRLLANTSNRAITRGGGTRTSEGNAGSLVQALAQIESVDERSLRRALVQDLLTEHFGKGLVNDARFQQVVDQVTVTLDNDPDAGKLLSRVIVDLRQTARKG